MKPFKRILVPVDFSSHSREAIRYAADLSRRYEASLTLVHVYQSASYVLPDGVVLYTPAQLASMLSKFEEHLTEAKADAEAAGGLRVETKLLEGAAFSEIVSFAQEFGYDLIVMGTHGRTGLAHALLGSVTERVMRKAPCPVLAVRLEEQH